MSDLTLSKSNLAKLLSCENLIVEQRNTKTAYFVPETRLLVIPKFKDELSNEILDLMISHECAHALWTPTEEWKISIKEVNQYIANLVEDSRIERLIKHRYPGLRHIYSKGYRELYNMDFFGTSKLNIEKLNLADKINLSEKIGFIESIEFNEEEKSLYDKVTKTKTFADVVRVAKEIEAYMKEHPQEIDEDEYEDNLDTQFDFDEDSDGDVDENENENDELTPIRSNSLDGNGSLSGDQKDDAEPGKSANKDLGEDEVENPVDEKSDMDDITSYTDFYSKMNLDNLLSDDNKESIYVDLPSFDPKKLIVDYKFLINKLKKDVKQDCINTNQYNLFKKENSAVISYLIKEFMLKKNAEGRKKERVAKTGDVNLSKVFSYKFNDDIFKRATIVPNQQSHGLVFFLDWSGSMESYLNDTVKQLLCMLLFCKKMNIPFEVYAFTTNFNDLEFKRPFNEEHQTINVYPLTLMNLFSSRMSNTEFTYMTNLLLSRTYNHFSSPKSYERIPVWFQLGNTPLNHSILISRKILQAFKDTTKVDKVNAIYMTDGDSHNVDFNYIQKNSNYVSKQKIANFYYKTYLRDKETKTVHKYSFNTKGQFKETDNCVDFLKDSCDFKLFSFRLVSSNEMRKMLLKFFPTDALNKKKEFAKNNCLLYPESSFDAFYFVKANSNVEGSEELDGIDSKETVNSITKKFQKALVARTNNKVFLRKYIEFIA